MNMFELFLIAVGLSMDAFAVSVCKGLSVQRLSPGITSSPAPGSAASRP